MSGKYLILKRIEGQAERGEYKRDTKWMVETENTNLEQIIERMEHDKEFIHSGLMLVKIIMEEESNVVR